MAHWGVKSDDMNIQRPLYLGGLRNPVQISEVLNTSDTATADQGNMSGHGISVGQSKPFSRYFKEHGIIMGIMSIMPKTMYSQGIPKKFSRSDRYDFYFPEFARLGEEEILNKEIFFDEGDNSYSAGTFGYQSRYADYKQIPDTVHGAMKSSLDHWHIGRQFSSQPTLNQTFVECFPSRS